MFVQSRHPWENKALDSDMTESKHKTPWRHINCRKAGASCPLSAASAVRRSLRAARRWYPASLRRRRRRSWARDAGLHPPQGMAAGSAVAAAAPPWCGAASSRAAGLRPRSNRLVAGAQWRGAEARPPPRQRFVSPATTVNCGQSGSQASSLGHTHDMRPQLLCVRRS